MDLVTVAVAAAALSKVGPALAREMVQWTRRDRSAADGRPGSAGPSNPSSARRRSASRAMRLGWSWSFGERQRPALGRPSPKMARPPKTERPPTSARAKRVAFMPSSQDLRYVARLARSAIMTVSLRAVTCATDGRGGGAGMRSGDGAVESRADRARHSPPPSRPGLTRPSTSSPGAGSTVCRGAVR